MKKIEPRPCLEKITPYIPGKPIEEVERELELAGVVKLASNENPLGPSPLALKAIKEHLPRVSLYPDGNCYYLREALAGKLGVQMDNIVVGNGADELISIVGRAYLNPGDEIIMGEPSFTEYDFCARLMDAVPIRVPLRDFRFDLQAMVGAVNDKTRIVFVCNPNNPTGTAVSHEELKLFLKGLPPGVLVVIDEAYYEYVSSPDYPRSLELLAEGYNVLVLRTFSKIYGLAGLRVGYGIAPEAVVAALNRVREPFNVNALAQCAARAALRDDEHVRAGRRLNEEGKSYLEEEFRRLGFFFPPTETNFFFVEVGVDSRALFQALLRRGFIVRSGDIFGCPQFIRVSIGTGEQNRRFIAVLEETLKELAGTG